MVDGVHCNRIGVVDGFADVAQSLVYCVGQGVDGCRLLIAGDDQRATPVFLQIADQGRNPALFFDREISFGLDFHPQFPRHGQGQGLDLSGAQGQPVVGQAAGGRGGAFHHI